MIFESPHLFVRRLEISELPPFYELMSNKKVMALIPSPTMTYEESAAFLNTLIELEQTSDTRIWCVCEKGNNELIGLCGLLKNAEQQDEIAYRFIERYWGKGYGTEIAKALIKYCFSTSESQIITADVYIENKGSIKILEKFFRPTIEFYNAEDDCMDRRYVLERKDWESTQK